MDLFPIKVTTKPLDWGDVVAFSLFALLANGALWFAFFVLAGFAVAFGVSLA